MSSTTQAAAPALEGAPQLVLPGRRDSIAAGWTWIARGFGLFTRAWLMWIISLVIVLVAGIAVGIIPILGTIAFYLAQSLFMGGWMYACLSLERGGEFELDQLFAGFSKRFVPLIVVGALYAAGWLVIALVMLAFGGMAFLSAMFAGDTEAAAAAITAAWGSFAIGGLIALGLSVPLMAAYWFAPALVMIHGMGPVAAMKESFFACFRNFVPFVLYGIVMFVLAIVAVIPIFLGLLVWVPVMIASIYAGYRTIFTEAEPLPPAP